MDKDENTTVVRIAVLEKIAESHERRISDVEDFHRAVVERLDQKIQLDAINQITLEKTLAKAVVSLDLMADNLKTAMVSAQEANLLANKHEIIGHTILKVSGVLGTIVAVLWTVFQLMPAKIWILLSKLLFGV